MTNEKTQAPSILIEGMQLPGNAILSKIEIKGERELLVLMMAHSMLRSETLFQIFEEAMMCAFLMQERQNNI